MAILLSSAAIATFISPIFPLNPERPPEWWP
jgi:hypothetical protein